MSESAPQDSEAPRANDAADAAAPPNVVVNTQGGAGITGNVTVQKGDFVGRDRVTHVNVPRIILIGLGAFIAVAVAAAAFFIIQSLRPRTPERMTGEFNIAIAGFDQSDQVSAAGQSDPRDGMDIASRITERFNTSLDKESGFQVWGPEQVGTVHGQTSAERERSAQAIAERVKADVVVYGIITKTAGGWQIAPEFFSSVDQFYRVGEIAGQHALGAAIAVSGQSNIAERAKTSKALTARTQVLHKIVNGLSYFAVRDFRQALRDFQAVAAMDGCAEAACQKVMYLMAGNAALILAGQDATLLPVAQEAFSESLKLDPDYARAYVGLANTLYASALPPSVASGPSVSLVFNTDVALLDRAIATYERALTVKNQPALADIPTKVRFGLGRSYLVKALMQLDPQFDRAKREFEPVIAEYEVNGNTRIREFAAEAHANLGVIYARLGEAAKAASEYDKAADIRSLVVNPFYDPGRTELFRVRANQLRGTDAPVPAQVADAALATPTALTRPAAASAAVPAESSVLADSTSVSITSSATVLAEPVIAVPMPTAPAPVAPAAPDAIASPTSTQDALPVINEVVAATPTLPTQPSDGIAQVIPATVVPLPSSVLLPYPQPSVIHVSDKRETFSLATANRTLPDDALNVLRGDATAGYRSCPPPTQPSQFIIIWPVVEGDSPRTELLTHIIIKGCSWLYDQRLSISVTTPIGERYALPDEMLSGPSNQGEFSFTFTTNLDDPPGRYTLTFTGGNNSASIDIDIPAPDGPRLRVVDRTSNGMRGRLLLYNFAPRERVRVFAYRQMKFEGWQEYEVDGRGRLEINSDPADALDWFVVLGNSSGPVEPFEKDATYKIQKR